MASTVVTDGGLGVDGGVGRGLEKLKLGRGCACGGRMVRGRGGRGRRRRR